MATNDRKYSLINSDQVIPQFGQILKAKQGSIADFGNSSYGRTLIELWGAHNDLNASWIESAFRDSFLETAQNIGPVFAAARTLGYSVRRPVPARAGFGIALKRTGAKSTVKVIIPKNTQFSISGVNLLTIDDVEFTSDRNSPDFNSGIMTLVSGRAIVIESVVRTQQFFSDGTQFQQFNLTDSTFSDWYGAGDPNYIEPNAMVNRLNMFTVLTSDSGLLDNPVTIPGYEDTIFWRISRRGLYDPYLDNPTLTTEVLLTDTNKTSNFTVLVETANDGTVNISFGDGVLSAVPFGLINITYLSTKGESGNLLNVAGNNLNTSATDIIITQLNGQESDLTLDDLNIALTTDIRGGLDIESVQSIQKNASKVYASLDSLGSSNTYKLFLSKQFDIRYVNAFGEDIISKPSYNKFNIKYSNVVRYTLLRDLYRVKDGNYYTTDPLEYMVDGYKVNGILYTWEYDYTALPAPSDVVQSNINIATVQTNIDNDNLLMIQLNPNQNLFSTIQTATGGSSNTIILSSSASTVDEFYNGYTILILSGVGSGQFATVLSYDGTTQTATLTSNWTTLPTSASVISIYNELTSSQFTAGYIPKLTSLVPSSIFNAHLGPKDFITTGSDLDNINDALNRRGYLTLENDNHVYFPPTVHSMGMTIDVILLEGSVFSDIKTSIIQAIYAYLKEYTDFESPIYRSKIESLIQTMPEVAGLNLAFVPQSNPYTGMNLDQLLWLGSQTSQLIRQDTSVLNLNNIQVSFLFGYPTPTNPQDITINIPGSAILEVQNLILNYYITKLSSVDSSGNRNPSTNVSEEQITQFCSYVWSNMLNTVFSALNTLYMNYVNNGDLLNQNLMFNLIESIRGWYFSNGAVLFNDTVNVTNLHEGTTSTLFQYFTYTIEYIKLIRDIFATIKAGNLIDTDGNITNYSNSNEIVQFTITSDDINLTLGKN